MQSWEDPWKRDSLSTLSKILAWILLIPFAFVLMFVIFFYGENPVMATIAVIVLCSLTVFGPLLAIMHRRKRLEKQNRVRFENSKIILKALKDGATVKELRYSDVESFILDVMHGAIFATRNKNESALVKALATGDHESVTGFLAGYAVGGLAAGWGASSAINYVRTMNAYYDVEKHLFACQVSNWNEAKKFLDNTFEQVDSVHMRYYEYKLSHEPTQTT